MKKCPTCSKPTAYNGLEDSYACLGCNKWLEAKCSDLACTYCTNRPETPDSCHKTSWEDLEVYDDLEEALED